MEAPCRYCLQPGHEPALSWFTPGGSSSDSYDRANSRHMDVLWCCCVSSIQSIVMWVLIMWWLYNGRTRTWWVIPASIMWWFTVSFPLTAHIQCPICSNSYWPISISIIRAHTVSPFAWQLLAHYHYQDTYSISICSAHYLQNLLSDTPYNFDHTSQGLIRTGEWSIYPPFLTWT